MQIGPNRLRSVPYPQHNSLAQRPNCEVTECCQRIQNDKVIREPLLNRITLTLPDRISHPVGNFSETTINNGGNVLTAVSKWTSLNSQHGQTAVKVFTEF